MGWEIVDPDPGKNYNAATRTSKWEKEIYMLQLIFGFS